MVEPKTPGVLDTPGVSLPTVLGMDVGATKILVGIVTQDGEVIEARRYPMDRTSQGLALNSIEAALAHFMENWHGPAPKAMGAGVVGQTQPAAGLWVRAMNLPIQSLVPLIRLLRRLHRDRPGAGGIRRDRAQGVFVASARIPVIGAVGDARLRRVSGYTPGDAGRRRNVHNGVEPQLPGAYGPQ